MKRRLGRAGPEQLWERMKGCQPPARAQPAGMLFPGSKSLASPFCLSCLSLLCEALSSLSPLCLSFSVIIGWFRCPTRAPSISQPGVEESLYYTSIQSVPSAPVSVMDASLPSCRSTGLGWELCHSFWLQLGCKTGWSCLTD